MRAAMAEHDVDALLVCGSEYSGFEGAVRYLSGFRIVHRYAYVLLAASGDPMTIFPSEARYVGEHAEGWIGSRSSRSTRAPGYASTCRAAACAASASTASST